MANRIVAAERPFCLTFLASGGRYLLSQAEAQRLLDEYPAVRVQANRVVLHGHNTSDPHERTVLEPATFGGGPAFWKAVL